MNISAPSTNLPTFRKFQNGSSVIRGTFISPAGTGLWGELFFLYSNRQLEAELTVCRTFCLEP